MSCWALKRTYLELLLIKHLKNRAGFSKIILTFNTIHNEDTLVFDHNMYIKDANNPYIFISRFLTNNIGTYAFENCESLTKIVIHNSVHSIGKYAFSNCQSLTNIVIPDSVTIIGNFAFNNCQSLNTLVIPYSVTNIGHYAFDGCSSLNTLVIPDSVTTIGKEIFYDCPSLTRIETNEEHVYIIQYCKEYYPDIEVIATNNTYVL